MTQADPLDEAAAWAACLVRDKSADGRFVFAVSSTGVYCRPSCGARHPRRENVRFFPHGAAAQEAGFRPCLRCRPDEQARDAAAVEQAQKLISDGQGGALADLAAAVGYTPSHFQRLFKRATGLSPAAYARALRAERLAQALAEGETTVTDAIYDAGYEAPSRAYVDAAAALGMAPGRWQRGGAGVTIRYTVARSSLGPLLIAATDKGLCRIAFDEGEADLRARFPNAVLVEDAMASLVEQVLTLIDNPAAPSPELPTDVAGTPFQRAIWAALRAIPPGETRSYAQLAAQIGRPGASRAAGSACGDNALAVLIPCHRVLRGDGALGGYAWGLDRKKALLDRERG